MRIVSQATFVDEVEFSKKEDMKLESMLLDEKYVAVREQMAANRGSAVRTLLECLSARCRAENAYNENKYFTDTSYTLHDDGIRKGQRNSPLLDTIVFKDGEHMFMFREVYVDPNDNTVVDVFDRLTLSARKDMADTLKFASDREITDALLSGKISRIVGDEIPDDSDVVIIRSIKRTGLVGGIVYHPTVYEVGDGSTITAGGSWSTHT